LTTHCIETTKQFLDTGSQEKLRRNKNANKTELDSIEQKHNSENIKYKKSAKQLEQKKRKHICATYHWS